LLDITITPDLNLTLNATLQLLVIDTPPIDWQFLGISIFYFLKTRNNSVSGLIFG